MGRRSIERTWWDSAALDGVALRHYLARREIGPVFRAVHRLGWSLAAIAAAADMTAGRVSEVAAGRREVTGYAVLERIAEGLGIPRHYMGLGYGEPDAGYGDSQEGDDGDLEDPVQRRTLIGALASLAVGAVPADIDRWLPRTVGSAAPAIVTGDAVASVRTITDVHRRMDAVRGGGACLASARGYLGWATGMLSADADDAVAVELRRALADLHNLVGWLAHDLDRHAEARRHLTRGLVLARQIDDLPLMADSYYRLGRVSLHQGVPDEALHLFGLGQLVAQSSGCLTSLAVLHANEAWAYALLGVPDRVTDSLTRAHHELQRADRATVPAWNRFATTEADVHGMAGVVYGALARHDGHRRFAEEALSHSTQSVNLRRPAERRSHLFDLIAVADAATLAGEYSQAARYADQAVTVAADGAVLSNRALDRLQAMWQLAAPHAERHRDLAAAGARIGALQPAP